MASSLAPWAPSPTGSSTSMMGGWYNKKGTSGKGHRGGGGGSSRGGGGGDSLRGGRQAGQQEDSGSGPLTLSQTGPNMPVQTPHTPGGNPSIYQSNQFNTMAGMSVHGTIVSTNSTALVSGQQQHSGSNSVHFAAYEGKLEKVKRYIRRGGDLEVRDRYGSTPLLLAAEKGHTDIVALLLDNGADVQGKDQHDYTSLHTATYHGNLETVTLLMERGANLFAQDDRGRRPLALAQKKELYQLLVMKEKEAAFGDDIFTAIKSGNLDAVRSFARSKASRGLKSTAGMTPLHFACFHGLPEVTKILLEAGSDPCVTDDTGDTPLHLACYNGNTQAIKLLCEAGANTMAVDANGKTPAERNSKSLGLQLYMEQEAYANLPRNIAHLRKSTVEMQQRVDSNESLFVQKATAIKGLKLALQERDVEVLKLKRRVTEQDADIRMLREKMVLVDKMVTEVRKGGNRTLNDLLKEATKETGDKTGSGGAGEGCIIS